MLQIKNINKTYRTGDFIQKALIDVNLNFRSSEFVAILGPSGSGKTTLLNIIGGLDSYDEGDLIINNISTKNYKDKDWDSYRNHTIGFIFQSYNLILHQTVLSNVELALTISGIGKTERRKRALEALKKVGLGDQIHKKPNQLSGGQMQRVAIARALVNNPSIVLADEPTGALDSETSIQIMDLLKEIAKDKLVIMVTHNPELAQDYASRIICLSDGRIVDDSLPYDTTKNEEIIIHKNMGKSSMSLKTSLALSFNNLMTKKARTLLTSFAGSIGIIGIALILALSNGVNMYIDNIQKETMTSYPISIEEESVDMTSMMGTGMSGGTSKDVDHDKDKVYSNASALETASQSTSVTENNLTDFKKYLDNDDSKINQYIGKTGILYSYNVSFDTYAYDTNGVLVNTDGSTLSQEEMMSQSSSAQGMMGGGGASMMSSSSSETFEELLPGTDDNLVADATKDSYDIVYGHWPENKNEVILVLDENNEVSLSTLYALGYLPSEEYEQLMDKMNNGEDIEFEQYDFDYDKIVEQTFYVVPATDYYQKNENGTYNYIGDDEGQVKQLLENATQLKISGIISPKEDAANANLTGVIGYTQALSNDIISYANESNIVKEQLASPDVDVLTGIKFSPESNEEKIENVKVYINNLGISDKANLMKSISTEIYKDNRQIISSLSSMSETQLADLLDDYMLDPNEDILLSIYDSYIDIGSYEDNMETFGYVNYDKPSSISIYADSFEDKEAITQCIEDYNASASEENQIVYTDMVEVLMSSVTTIIDVISYILIAFVAVSLIVSSIMIGIITYISVLERTKEIGVLRAIGASKRNISNIFNAETLIVGFCAGVIGIVLASLILVPTNLVIQSVLSMNDLAASLPVSSALILIVLSVFLTLIGGWIPARKASKKDPVIALRSE